MEIAKIEDRLDKAVAATMPINQDVAGVRFVDMGQVMEFAKLMAVAGKAVPKHLRGEPGTCLAVAVQAMDWQMSPFAVANKSYEVNDRIAYESQLIHAVIETRAPLVGRLRDTYEGEGIDRRCTISGKLRGDDKPFVVTSPSIRDIKVKNSPLWTADPDQQLFYYTSRTWARRYCPDVLLGIYSVDELDESTVRGAATEASASPEIAGLKQRLGTAGPDGFNHANINKALEHRSEPPVNVVEAEVVVAEKQTVEAKPEKAPAKKKAEAEKKKPARQPEPEPQPESATVEAPPASAAAVADEPVTEGDIPSNLDRRARKTSETKKPEPKPRSESAYEEACGMLARCEESIKGGELPGLEDLEQFRTTIKTNIENYEGLEAEERDVLLGQWATITLNAKRDMQKRGVK